MFKKKIPTPHAHLMMICSMHGFLNACDRAAYVERSFFPDSVATETVPHGYFVSEQI